MVALGPVLNNSRTSNKHWAFCGMELLVVLCAITGLGPQEVHVVSVI